VGLDYRNVGGTRGGLIVFLLGLAMTLAGAYLLLTQVTVHGGFWTYFGWEAGQSFGLTLLPLLIGVGLLFANGRSRAGWLLVGAGAVVILVGIIANLQIYFRPTSLYNTLAMFVLFFGGLGLMARSVFAMGEAKS